MLMAICSRFRILSFQRMIFTALSCTLIVGSTNICNSYVYIVCFVRTCAFRSLILVNTSVVNYSATWGHSRSPPRFRDYRRTHSHTNPLARNELKQHFIISFLSVFFCVGFKNWTLTLLTQRYSARTLRRRRYIIWCWVISNSTIKN